MYYIVFALLYCYYTVTNCSNDDHSCQVHPFDQIKGRVLHLVRYRADISFISYEGVELSFLSDFWAELSFISNLGPELSFLSEIQGQSHSSFLMLG